MDDFEKQLLEVSLEVKNDIKLSTFIQQTKEYKDFKRSWDPKDFPAINEQFTIILSAYDDYLHEIVIQLIKRLKERGAI